MTRGLPFTSQNSFHSLKKLRSQTYHHWDEEADDSMDDRIYNPSPKYIKRKIDVLLPCLIKNRISKSHFWAHILYSLSLSNLPILKQRQKDIAN
jgi:hypothetical protein